MTDINEEVKDPEGLLKAYRKLQADIVALRAENEELAKKAASENAEKFKAIARDSMAKAAIAASGVKNADRVVKHMNLDQIDFDEEGNLVGLDEAINGFKQDFPELFDPKLRAAGKADAHTPEAPEKKKSASELQAEALFNS